MLFRILSFILICLLSSTNLAAQQTKILNAEKHNEYGLVYTLPKTAFRIDITIVRETQVAGPFYKYAKIFGGTTDVISKNSKREWVEGVTVTPFGVPDSDNRYLMQLKTGATAFIAVADDNMLLAINKEDVENPSLSIPKVADIHNNPAPDINNYLKYVNEDFISAISDYKKAQLMAEELQEIREAKLSLTRGTAETMPTDGRQLEIMLNSLEDQETSLLNAFRGIRYVEKEIRSFTFIPDPENDVTSAYYPDVKVKVEITEIQTPELPVDTKGEEKKLPKDAVIYRIPGTVKLNISTDSQQLFSNIFEIAQTGINFGLSPSLFSDKKEPSFATFNPTNGALQELGVVK